MINAYSVLTILIILKKSLMKSITFFICFIACILTIADTAWAHGIRGKIISKTGILAEAEYDDGEPMSYASVEVFNLKENLPFQTGRTDRNGRFLFLPDNPGDWRVVVNDEMGHRIVLKTRIDENINLNKNQNQTDKTGYAGFLSRYEKILAGVAIVFGMFGFLFWWKGKKCRS
jgi:nickel transport protein